eukprot:9421627-Karenia_brevis.AAC.1
MQSAGLVENVAVAGSDVGDEVTEAGAICMAPAASVGVEADSRQSLLVMKPSVLRQRVLGLGPSTDELAQIDDADNYKEAL